MSITIDFTIHPDYIHNTHSLRQAIKEQSPDTLPDNFHFKITRRNIDARHKSVKYILRAEVSENEQPIIKNKISEEYKNVSQKKPVHIIGAGPCGYFAALELIRHGLKPIIIERGKDVRERRKDLRAIQQESEVNPNSNYCFGEGGAGTYSDGKLYTRSNKRGNIHEVLEILVEHGAHPDILIDVHPHIGSNKLPAVVQKIRQTIIEHGGEVYFNQKLEDIEIKNNQIAGFRTQSAEFASTDLILSTGHSARDIYQLLHDKNIAIEAKPFALGVRIEHPQSLIDEIQYHQSVRHPNLPAASYSLSCQVEQSGVFSFCMCPGGLIVPAATSPGEIVVNGMSLSRRDSPFANSGLVTAVDESDFVKYAKHQGLKAMLFQKDIEQKVFQHGNGSQCGPSQRIMDLLHNKLSQSLPSTSYIPGIYSADMKEFFPKNILERIKQGLKEFGKKMPTYLTNEAIVVATESRTSAPVRIPRHSNTCEHIQVKGFFPAGEGAGYAGGILSAALDGIRVAKAIALLK